MKLDRLTGVRRWVSAEALFTLLLWALFFIGTAYDDRRDRPHLHFRDVVFALNYFVAVLLINYWLLPRFLYRKRYLGFLLLGMGIFAASIAVEEFVLEPIFFPNTERGQTFQGVWPTISEVGSVLLLFVGFKLAWDNLKKQSQLERLEKEKMESQLQFLRSQLNPHFLFNNLNNLYSYAQENSPKTPGIILQLSAIMRYVLYESQGNFVPLEKELKYLEDFIRLQELQLEGRGAITFAVQGDPYGKVIAPLILIAFVENCFKHSLSTQAENIVIDIRADVRENQLDFRCSNTYSPTTNTSNEYLGKGIGLDNVRKRLELLYPGRHQLETRATETVFYADLQLDLHHAA